MKNITFPYRLYPTPLLCSELFSNYIPDSEMLTKMKDRYKHAGGLTFLYKYAKNDALLQCVVEISAAVGLSASSSV